MSTIKDVARLAGVGVATASRALSGNGSVAGETAVRVRAAAKSLDFRPSSIAQALSLRRSGAIGVYVPVFDGAFYSRIAASIDGALRSAGRHMVATNGYGEGSARQQALDGIDFLIGRECDGLMVASHSLTDEDVADVVRRCPRAVVLNRVIAGHADRCFSVDHEIGGRIAARALLQRGHREIAVIAGPPGAPDSVARMRGFLDELARRGVDVPSSRRADGDFTFASGAAGADRLARSGRPEFTALFAANDLMAMAAIGTLSELGLRVPQRVSVIGYDDSIFATFTSPPLTTVHIPMDPLAVNGCHQVLNDCYELNLPVERDFSATIAWRSSVVPGPHALIEPGT